MGKKITRRNNLQSKFAVRGKRVLILGLGGYTKGSGVSAAMWCARHGAARVVVSDLKSATELKDNVKQLQKYQRAGKIEFCLGENRLANVHWADFIVLNPAVPQTAPAVRLARRFGKTITNDIGLFLAHKPVGRVVAVTGTRGKSTTAALCYELLRSTYRRRVFLGGNIGVSPLQFIDQMQPWDIAVLELSSWMLHDLERPQFDVAIVTNILPDHLNMYPSLAAYQKDKEKIWRWQKKEAFLLLNAADKKVAQMAASAPSTEMWIHPRRTPTASTNHEQHHACVHTGKIMISGEEVASVRDVRVPGEHNYFNVLAAVTVAKIFGVVNKQIVQVLRSFRGLPHRLELVRTVRGVSYYNDTAATMPHATTAALQTFPRQVILIAGGNSKGLSLKNLAQLLPKKVKKLILLKGNANASLKKAFKNFVEVESIVEAVLQAARSAKKGDIVLLSPACSWLPRMNEFERGRQFVQAVKRL